MDSLKKLDAVAANKIWVERLNTEKKCTKINENFRINPKQLKRDRMPQKPCVVDPNELVRGVEKAQPKREDMTEEERELQDSIFKAAKAPQEKYKWPMTANQMIGWSWKDANEFREDDKKWLATHAQSEIVKYNENYVLAFGKSPFAR